MPLHETFTLPTYSPVVNLPQPPSRLGRSLGLASAVTIGVSAMVGTGVFAVWQPALDRAGSYLLAAVMIAMVVAALNATSTARLAARIPQAGGVYAYGRAQLGRAPGVVAGLVFLVGKTASASAAALTIGLYVWPERPVVLALAAIVVALVVNLRGIVRSTRVAGIMVFVVVGVLIVLIVTVASGIIETSARSTMEQEPHLWGLLAGSALIFVAFAGYARITVLGEEVRNPARTIPLAVGVSFAIVAVLYLAVAVVVEAVAGAGSTIGPAALLDVAQLSGYPALVVVVSLAAVLAAGAVLMNLIAGVGRTLFAMANSGDAPRMFAAVGPRNRIPYRAELLAALGAAGLVLIGGLTLSLAISAGMILTYYGIAHISALRLPVRRSLGGLLMATTPLLGLLGCAVLVAAVFLAA